MAEKQCENRATIRRFWPGAEPDFVCPLHAVGWRNISEAMGFHLHMEPISDDVPEFDRKCCNMINAESPEDHAVKPMPSEMTAPQKSGQAHAIAHTPGPWCFGSAAVDGPDGWVNVLSEDECHGPIVASVLAGEVGVEASRVNARLIAAAPDLLEACKAVLAAIREASQDGTIIWLNPPHVLPGVHVSAAERLQNVIEQAESVE